MQPLYTNTEVLQIMQQLKEDIGSTALDLFLTKEADNVQSVMQAVMKTIPSLATTLCVNLPIIGNNVYVEYERNGDKSGLSLQIADQYLIFQGSEPEANVIRLNGEELQKIARDAFKKKQTVEVDGIKYVTFKISEL